MKQLLLCLLCTLFGVSCDKHDFPLVPDTSESDVTTLTLNVPNKAGIALKNNMKLVYFERKTVAGADTYYYEGSYDLNAPTYNAVTDAWSQQIASFPRKPLGVMLVAQEDVGVADGYLLPQGAQGLAAPLMRLSSGLSPIIQNYIYNHAPVILTSDLLKIEWLPGETSKTLNFNLKRIVGKLIVKINDPQGQMTGDIDFRISNHYTAINYDKTYAGATSSVETPSLLKVTAASKQGVAYLLPSVGAGSIGITPVNTAFTLQVNDPLPIAPNKITELTIAYKDGKEMTVTVVLKDWTEVGIPALECFDVTDVEGIGYKVIAAAGCLWLDRDLGAKYNKPRNPTLNTPENLISDDDWGYLFQFGRQRADGHQKRASRVTAGVLSTPYNIDYNWFVYRASPPYSWLLSNSTNPTIPLWINPQQNNNPCPKGFRLPTTKELTALYAKAAYDSTLKLYYVDGRRQGQTIRMYLSGKTYREYCNGKILFTPNEALYYWTSASLWRINDFFAIMPSIKLSGGTIVQADGDPNGISVSMGCGVRCVANDL
ncbi:MAG: hypothetical protein RSC12_04870 [Alistipes sp.]